MIWDMVEWFLIGLGVGILANALFFLFILFNMDFSK